MLMALTFEAAVRTVFDISNNYLEQAARRAPQRGRLRRRCFDTEEVGTDEA